MVMADKAELDLVDLPTTVKETSSEGVFLGGAFTVEEVETEHIRRVLAQKRSLQDAARVLNLDRKTLLRKRKEWNL